MGRTIVRSVVTTYLQNQNFTNVGTIYPARPIIVDDADYDAAMSSWLWEQQGLPDTGSAAVLIVNLPDDHRAREAITGRTGVNDTDRHEVVLEVFFANVGGGTATVPQGIVAQNDHDALIDSIVVALRADWSLGNPQQIFSSGEFQRGVDVSQGEPFTEENSTVIFIVATIHFDVYEWLAGVGV